MLPTDIKARCEQVRDLHDLRIEFPFLQGAKQKRMNGGAFIMTACPAGGGHGFQTPCLAIWKDHFFCFSCGAFRGDIITLTQFERGLNFFTALEFLEANTKFRVSPRSRELAPVPQHEVQELRGPYDFAVLQRYFEALKNETAQPLLDMGLSMDILGWAGIRTIWTGSFAVPVVLDNQLVDIKIYTPRNRASKWMPWEEGHGKHLYGYDWLKESGADYCLVMESEKDVWFSWQWDIPAVASGGASTWKPEYTGLLMELPLTDVFVLGDNDQAGRSFNQRVAGAIRRATALDWRLWNWNAEEGFDLAKFVKAGHTRDEFAHLMRAARKGEAMDDSI